MHEDAVKPDSEAYNELVNRLCAACSYDLNSHGFQLLEAAATAVTVAIEKLTELEQFVKDSKIETESALNSVGESGFTNVPVDIQSEFTIYFTINENVAKSHIIDALNNEGLTDFDLYEFTNRVQFAHGFISFKDEKSFQVITSKKMYVGNSVLKIVPKRRNSFKNSAETKSTFKKNKRKKKKTIQC